MNSTTNPRSLLLPDESNKAALLKKLAIRTLPQNVRCRRNPENDACSGCGSCCTRVIPLFPGEAQLIRKYLKAHVEITQKVLSLNEGMTHVMCPFLDFTKPSHQCMIYDSGVLPAICRCYTCNPEKKNGQLRQMLEERAPKTPKPCVDMWYTIFGKYTHDPDIAEYWGYNDLLRDWRYGVPSEFLMDPNRLPTFFEKHFSWRVFIRDILHLPLPSQHATSEEVARRYLRSLNPAISQFLPGPR